jgi:hypothetical protein
MKSGGRESEDGKGRMGEGDGKEEVGREDGKEEGGKSKAGRRWEPGDRKKEIEDNERQREIMGIRVAEPGRDHPRRRRYKRAQTRPPAPSWIRPPP